MLKLDDTVPTDRQQQHAATLLAAGVALEGVVESLETLPVNHAARMAAEQAIDAVTEAAVLFAGVCDSGALEAAREEVRVLIGLPEDWQERYRRGEYDQGGQS